MSNPTLTIPQDVINPIIEAKINEAVIAAMGGSQEILTAAITSILNTKVDDAGKASGYRSDIPWITWAVGQSVRKAVSAAIEEAIGKHENLVRECLVKELKKRNSPMVRQLVRAMTDGIIGAANNSYRLTITVDDNE